MKHTGLFALLAALILIGSTNAADDAVVVVMETSHGTLKIELDAKNAPVTVKNFLDYADAKFFDGTVFHRVIDNFMIQGGGFETGMKEKKTKAAIKNESSNGLLNKKYTLAMARTSVPDSATSQFFINTKDNSFLDKANARDKVGYCVFGKVIEGKEVVDKIGKVKTGTRGFHRDVPVDDVVIKKVYRAKK